jgi:hypothetical protein
MHHGITEAPMPPNRDELPRLILLSLDYASRNKGKTHRSPAPRENVAHHQSSVSAPDGVSPAQSLNPSLSPPVLFCADLQARAKTPLSSPRPPFILHVRHTWHGILLRGCWDPRDFLEGRKVRTLQAAAAFSRGRYSGEESADIRAPPASE